MTDRDALQFLQTYCVDCHQGQDAEAHLDVAKYDSLTSIVADVDVWNKIERRVRDGEMPPVDGTLPPVARRAAFADWIQRTLQQAACGDGIAPGSAPMRRLNRTEYANTIRDLLGIHVDVASGLPAEGSGGEGFDNAAETLFISPIHAEKYLEAARTALTHALRDPRARRQILTSEPADGVTPRKAADDVLDDFMPKAFRRPVAGREVEPYLGLFHSAYQREPSFDLAIQLALEAVLISPDFLFLVESPNLHPEPRLRDDFELAARLSYFLWSSMPDDELFGLARRGGLRDPEVLRQQTVRMLQSTPTLAEDQGQDRESRRRRRRRATKLRGFAQSFVEQWLGTRALGREFKPDPQVAGRYDSELEGGMKYEPVLFFEDIVANNLSLLNLIDADFTYANRRLARHYGIPGSFREQPRRTELPGDSHRGGLLGMSAVLAVSSHPYRTSPVLRGKWILETLLGTPPPPPPPDVPQLEERKEGEPPRSLRARLEQHRADARCAACHDRIDPLGFGLENYDVLGRWRTEEDGQPIDSRGQLPNGVTFDGPEELKQVLLQRKDQFVRNLTAKVLGFALGRGLTHEDYCVVDQIAEQLERDEYASHTLVLGIVQSVPFRYKSGSDPLRPVVLAPAETQTEQERP